MKCRAAPHATARAVGIDVCVADRGTRAGTGSQRPLRRGAHQIEAVRA
jgi:hypothetical protein